MLTNVEKLFDDGDGDGGGGGGGGGGGKIFVVFSRSEIPGQVVDLFRTIISSSFLFSLAMPGFKRSARSSQTIFSARGAIPSRAPFGLSGASSSPRHFRIKFSILQVFCLKKKDFKKFFAR